MLDARRALGHDDSRRDLQSPSGVGHSLGMVTGAAGDDTLPALITIQMRHLVVGAPQLKAEDGLLVFPFEQDIAFESVGKIDSGGQ